MDFTLTLKDLLVLGSTLLTIAASYFKLRAELGVARRDIKTLQHRVYKDSSGDLRLMKVEDCEKQHVAVAETMEKLAELSEKNSRLLNELLVKLEMDVVKKIRKYEDTC